MIRQTYHLEIITPCFCAGADQAKAEIRAPSIRGQLRWWFRLVGGTPQEEAIVFGTAAGNDDCSAASVCVRVTGFKPGTRWTPPVINQNAAENYVWHFASVSGTTVRGAKGPRWTSQGAVAPGSTFQLDLVWRRVLGDSLKKKFDLALNAFLALGTLGLRGTRGLGAFHCAKAGNLDELEKELAKHGFVTRRRDRAEGFPSYESALKDYAAWLRYDFRKQFKADRPSPLGSSTPRQTSAVRFRPFKRTDGRFGWLAYEAPHTRVLGIQSQRNEPLLKEKSFTGLAPAAASPAP